MILLLIPVSLKMYASTKNLRANFYIGGRDYLYRKISTWLTENPTQCQTIAVYEPGTLAYYSDRNMIDMMGLTTLGVGDEMKRLQVREAPVDWISAEFDPECFIILTSSADAPPSRMPQLPDYTAHEFIFDEVSGSGLILYGHESMH